MRFIPISAAVLLLISSCDSQIISTFGNLFELQNAVVKVVEAEDVGVNIHNGRVLGITIVNSPLNNSTSELRKTSADQIAAIVYKKYENRDVLKQVYVVFNSYERKYFIVEFNRSIEMFSYNAKDLKIEYQANDPGIKKIGRKVTTAAD